MNSAQFGRRQSDNSMPIGRVQRKPSNEFGGTGGGGVGVGLLDSSTLDSRMSSAEIPQMELLKVNYVHQCKEALMHKPSDLLPPSQRHSRPLPPPPSTAQLQQRHLQQQHHNYNEKFGRVSNVRVGVTAGKGQAPLPPPPPTIESWQLLQQAASNKPPSSSAASAQAIDVNCSACCSEASNCDSCSSEDSEAPSTDGGTLAPGGCEKSNSWNYRTKLSTCDMRRDMARAGIKSRADRIARIERSDCEHRQQRASLPASLRERERERERESLEAPPQPRRPAPPMKEPNTRRRPLSMHVTSTPSAGNAVGGGPTAASNDCCDCALAQTAACRSASAGRRRRRSPSPAKKALAEAPRYNGEARHFVSRIPQRQQPPQSSQQAQRSAQQQPPEPSKPQSQQLSRALYADVKPKQKVAAPAAPKRAEPVSEDKHEREAHGALSDFEQQLMRNASAHQRVKMERIHIRPKKRQPLLIINQLNETTTTTTTTTKTATTASTEPHEEVCCDDGWCDEAAPHKERRRTCGYKNCNYSKCPMSEDPQKLAEHAAFESKLKRLSLESCCSDSGVSSSNDSKEQHCQLKANNMKNLAKCADCVQVLQQRGQLARGGAPAQLKLQEMALEKEVGTQIKIHVNKSPSPPTLTAVADPNDVQNFAKKNLTKVTTDELLTASSKAATKQCNIENELKNNLRQQRAGPLAGNNNNNNNTTTIRIDNDDDWLPEPGQPSGKPLNANSVKIFVRSSSQCDAVVTSVNRVSISQTSAYTTNASCCYAAPTSATSSSSSVSTASSLSSASTASSTSGCGTFCSQADALSLCGSEKEGSERCCCSRSETRVGSRTDTMRACPPSPLGSELSCATCRTQTSCNSSTTTIKPALTHDAIAVGGVFWNNSYFYHHHHEHAHERRQDGDQEEPCYCSLSSCDDDNCSYYELDAVNGADGGAAGSDPATTTTAVVPLRSAPPPMQRQLLHANSALTKQLLRRTDVIHELRPRSIDGVGGLDSGISVNGDNGSSPDSEHMQNQQDSEARRLKRGHVLTELLETERIYVNEMSSILKGYCDQMQSEELMHLVPASLQGKEDILFGNLHELYTFHNEIFLKDLENCISTTELVALCFVQRRDTFYRLYSFYCQNIPRSDRLRETLVDTHLFLQECQKRLGHKLPLAAYLLKPVQRITKYQLLLKDLLRFSDSGSCTKELQKALDCMLIVLKCVNDSMHQVAITGFPSDLSQQGELLLQDSFQVWSESKKEIRMRIKPQQRHIFLYQKSMLFCKQTSKPGHNKSTYQFKHHLKMSQIGLTESVRGDTKRFEVWLQGRQEVHTLQAPSIEIKNKWVAEIKRVLLNQLEELKGEKIKQYGLNHRGLRQTTSWDTPNILLGAQRNISCDASSESSNRNSNCSSSGDDNCTTPLPPPATLSVLTSTGSSNASNSSGGSSGVGVGNGITANDKEQQEACGWSSDYSNSEDEMSIIEDNSTPGSKFIALADYVAMGHSEVSISEGDTIELLKVGCAGWWYVRVLDANTEGWTPAAYLESLNRKSSRSSSRNQERLSLPNKFND